MIGIGSAQNYLPESTMEPGAGLSMFEGDPGHIEMWSGNVNNATHINTTYYSSGELIGELTGYPVQDAYNIIIYNHGDTIYAKYSNGSILTSGTYGTDDATVFQAAMDETGNIFIGCSIDVGATTITFEGDTAIFGPGKYSGIQIEGTADPLIQVVNDGSLEIHDIQFDMEANNTCIYINQSAVVAPKARTILDSISFYCSYDHAEGGKNFVHLIDGDGITISLCDFESIRGSPEAEWGGATKGILIEGGDGYGPVDLDISLNNFYHVKYGIYATGYEAGTEDIKIFGNEMLGCQNGIWMDGIVEVKILYNNIDNVHYPVKLLDVQSPEIVGNWIWARATNAKSIDLRANSGNLYRARIIGNDIGSYAVDGDAAIYIRSDTARNIYDVIILGNNIYNDEYGMFFSPGGTITNVIIGDNIIRSMDAYGIVFNNANNADFNLHDNLFTSCAVGNMATANSVRTIIDGWSTNVGDPSSAGQWNGYGREGLMVRDTSGAANYVYVNGGWVRM